MLAWAALLASANTAIAQDGSAAPDPTLATPSAAAPRLTQWRFLLPRPATTSAGVYNDQGQLIRTLWRSEALARGEHEKTWDERDDSGSLVAEGHYQIKLVHHQLSHVWEGVIGNSSLDFGGPQVHKSFAPPTDVAIVGTRAYYAVGYNEGQPGLHGFLLSAPQHDIQPFASTDPFTAYSMIAADTTRLYWANTGGLSRTSFIGAFDLQSAKPVAFPAGRSVCLNVRPNTSQCYEGHAYQGVADLQTDASQTPTGLAVQRHGRVLAVAHGAQNLIRLFDKTSGEPMREIAVPLAAKALNQLAMTPAGDLWVISGNTVLRYTDLDRIPRIAATLGSLDRPVALATSPVDDDTVWVADGGPSQQVKRFDRRGRVVGVIGRRGGYANDPLVAPDKLCFRAREGREQTAIAVAADATLWVVDYCNNRMLRFRTDAKPPAQSDAQLAYLPAVYTSTLDHGHPRRVFANFLEFDVDNAAPLLPGRSWTLARNWLAGLPASLVDDRAFNGAFGGFTSVETLSNGRTYGIVAAQGRQVVVELPASGPLRPVKVLAPAAPRTTAKVLYENGDLGYAMTGPGTQSVMRLALSGFDNANDPVWSAEPVKLATVPILPGSPFYRGAFSGMPPRFPTTGSGKIVFFDQSVTGNEGFHLGAAAPGGSGWLWQASPSGPLDAKGSFQTKAIDRSITYGGNSVWTSGRHIVYGFHGEFYKDLQTGKIGQANQFMHFDESGLFLGQFGQPSTRPASPSQAGLSGNAFSPTLVRDGSRLYLYHNDESTHGGVHRWRIDGWADVVEMTGSGATGSSIVLHRVE
ncbi:MAG: FlgD immunoglobulin-like domain containing protein [Pseudomonadota bacterium]